MITKEEGNVYSLTCDECEDEVDEVFDTFKEAVEYKKDAEWKSIRNRETNEWHEICPSCAGKPGVYKKFAGIKSV